MNLPLGLLLLAVAVFNLAAFAAQGLDKRRSIRSPHSRLRERTLLLLGLPLAAPGMLYGMARFRHKTRKRSFQLKATAVVFANLLIAAGLGWLAMKGWLKITPALY
jgi:uncharacterized membrane protein YsdA (DUF1294 family)